VSSQNRGVRGDRDDAERAESGPGGLFPPAVRDGTATVVAVYVSLRDAGPLTYTELARATGASVRSVKEAIYDLRDAGLVETRPDMTTPQQGQHRLSNVD